MDAKEIREKAQSLVNGNVEEIDGKKYKAVRIPDEEINAPCYLCEVMCRKQSDVIQVCKEMDKLSSVSRYLQIVENE